MERKKISIRLSRSLCLGVRVLRLVPPYGTDPGCADASVFSIERPVRSGNRLNPSIGTPLGFDRTEPKGKLLRWKGKGSKRGIRPPSGFEGRFRTWFLGTGMAAMDVLRELVEDELRAVPYAYLAKKCQVDVDEAKRCVEANEADERRRKPAVELTQDEVASARRAAC